MENKINIYKQIRSFYRFVFNSDKNITPLHSSLYMFLLNQNNRANWVNWFKCPADTAMHGALINSNKTYYKTLNELVEFGLIEVQKGVNNFKAPKIKIIKLKYDDISENEAEIDTPKSSDVLNTPLLTLLNTPLLTPHHTLLYTSLLTLLPTLKDIPNTIIHITIKKNKEVKEKTKKSKPLPPSQNDVIDYFIENDYPKEIALRMFNYYDIAGWKDSNGRDVLNWKQKAQTVWFKPENKIHSRNTQSNQYKPHPNMIPLDVQMKNALVR